MKKLLSGIALLGVFVLASAQTIAFDKTTIDYGTIKPGADGNRVFMVKNTGDKPLILSNVKASCGCTTPVFKTDAIMPGKSAEIKVGYNTNLNGFFVKQIEVFSNDPVNNRMVLNITGTVDANAPEKVVPVKVLTPAEQKAEMKAKKKAQRAQVKADKKAAKMANHTAK